MTIRTSQGAPIGNAEGDGTVPMCLIPPRERGQAMKADKLARQRRGLLAKVHSAKRDLRLSDDEWCMIKRSFKVSSCADMTIPQLEDMVKLFKKHYGWQEPIRIRTEGTGLNQPPNPEQLAALQERARETWGQISNLSPSVEAHEKRLSGLVKKICGVDDLTWCRSAAKLERLLAVLGKIKAGGQVSTCAPDPK
ncbi:MAG TPA: phage protein GemA/Gp16 family protein [Acidobacteriota bacterium]|nr:phage protein GemA/Gp16 family protein [Acidobacteriota bacterium]